MNEAQHLSYAMKSDTFPIRRMCFSVFDDCKNKNLSTTSCGWWLMTYRYTVPEKITSLQHACTNVENYAEIESIFKNFKARRKYKFLQAWSMLNTVETRELKTARCHIMPPPLHLSDIRCKCFPYWHCHGKQITLLKGAMKERMNEGVCVDCWKILYNCLMNENRIA